ncbi:MAG: hypothetical protein LUD82_06305 [Clostridiales bacterium]|nr:hypothetical protein [Clostridiales bacterium]
MLILEEGACEVAEEQSASDEDTPERAASEGGDSEDALDDALFEEDEASLSLDEGPET